MRRYQEFLQGSKHNPGVAGDKYDELPIGYRRSMAMTALPGEELRILQREAEMQAAKFETLHSDDVADLYKELASLGERCTHVRKTVVSLRADRRTVHMRMIAYLHSPSLAAFSREHMIKQESAISELDTSIEGWTTKLEAAGERIHQIKQKLLEHAAAILMLEIPSIDERETFDYEPTPPLSPEDQEAAFSVERRDVESIRVYVDNGVASLLQSIEQEIEELDEQRIVRGKGELEVMVRGGLLNSP